MKKVVIIGAGPSGLYLAYKLYHKGVKNIVLYDPRAGNYTRPGHLSASVFLFLKKQLTSNNEEQWSKLQGHIKDFERILYQEMVALKIPVIRKKFIRFTQKRRGIVVADEHDDEEEVRCHWAFDCTGNKRELLHEINRIISPSPFVIEPVVPHINVKNHFLAYVRMNEHHLKRIMAAHTDSVEYFSKFTASEYVQNIEALRQLGWSEFAFPRCYGVTFPPDKVCLYLEAPENLPRKSYKKWVQTVINARTNNSDISFTTMDNSKKPRFVSFTVAPRAVVPAQSISAKLPLVFPNGDAQIEPDYFLAHGAEYGMKRSNVLVDSLSVKDGKINSFFATTYFEALDKLIQKQKQELAKHYFERASTFREWLKLAQIYYPKAIEEAVGKPEYETYVASFNETQAKLSYSNIVNLIEKYGLSPDNISRNTLSAWVLLQNYLLQAIPNFPVQCAAQKKHSLTILKDLADLWKSIGQIHYNQKLVSKAIKDYYSAAALFEHEAFEGHYETDALQMYQTIISCYVKLQHYEKIIPLARTLIESYIDRADLPVLKKFMDSLIKALNKEIKKNKPFTAEFLTYYNELSSFILLHPELLSKHVQLADYQSHNKENEPKNSSVVDLPDSYKPGFFNKKSSTWVPETSYSPTLN